MNENSKVRRMNGKWLTKLFTDKPNRGFKRARSWMSREKFAPSAMVPHISL